VVDVTLYHVKRCALDPYQGSGQPVALSNVCFMGESLGAAITSPVLTTPPSTVRALPSWFCRSYQCSRTGGYKKMWRATALHHVTIRPAAARARIAVTGDGDVFLSRPLARQFAPRVLRTILPRRKKRAPATCERSPDQAIWNSEFGRDFYKTRRNVVIWRRE